MGITLYDTVTLTVKQGKIVDIQGGMAAMKLRGILEALENEDAYNYAEFGIGLNPGHLIHLDEWLHSPIYSGSTEVLKSGMAMQVDVIPATGTRYFTTNIEDGIALADDALREAFASAYPEAWARIQARRDFMAEVLGIRLKPEVLPFSNIPAYLPPYLLSPGRAMRMRR